MLGLISEAAIFSISTISRLRQRDKAPLELTIEPSSQENKLESSDDNEIISDRESLLKSKIIDLWTKKPETDSRKDSILTDLPTIRLSSSDANSKIKKLWKLESRKALRKSESDSWADIFENLEPYKASRLRYNATKETWLEDKIQIKIEPKTFNEGKKAFKYFSFKQILKVQCENVSEQRNLETFLLILNGIQHQMLF